MACIVCGSNSVVTQLDVGSHPVASYFLTEKSAPEQAFPIALGQCTQCNTVQLAKPVPYQSLIPPYDWITAREPEEHLDAVVEAMLAFATLGDESRVAGLTLQDASTVERFKQKGAKTTYIVNPKDDLGIVNPAAGIETIQAHTTPEAMAAIAARYGLADLLVVRRIAEHAINLQRFMAGLGAMVRPGGLLFLEVPDCSPGFDNQDYCTIWEEHLLYFTPETASLLPALGGFEIIQTKLYPSPFENSFVIIARKVGEPQTPNTEKTLPQARLLANFSQGYAATKSDLRRYLTQFREEKGEIALFGAGHLAHAFANFMDVADLITFVADDTPQKQGKFLSGARLPILPSSELVKQNIKLCLLALSIKNEDNVIARNNALEANGGMFRSIFQASPRSIFKETRH